MNYLQYLWRAKSRHGIHSPFVFHLVSEIFNDPRRYDAYEKVAAIHERFKRNSGSIQVTDLGAGSKKMKGDVRKIQDIAKSSVKRAKYMKLMFRLVDHFEPAHILELGTSLGLTTHMMALASKESTVTTIEGCPETAALAMTHLDHVPNVNVIISDFDSALPHALENGAPDLVFVDGNHLLEPTLRYFQWCVNNLSDDAVLIFDDIHWSTGMHDAWERIKANDRVGVTIDIFEMGIVFFRKEQAKQHFIVRF